MNDEKKESKQAMTSLILKERKKERKKEMSL